MQFTDHPYTSEWKTIDSLEAQGLVRSALENTEKLYQRAKRERNPSQLIKSLMYKVKFQSGLEEDGQLVAVNALELELKTADFPERSILQSILGELYRGYLQSNYWRLNDRTDTPDYKSDDVRTWSAAQLISRSSELYDASVADERLAQVPLSQFAAITMPGRNTEALWPTLFDMLAHRAIDYFSDQTSYLNSPSYKFYIDKESALADASVFVAEKFTTRDTSSFQYKNLLLLQSVLLRHLNDKDPAALIDADLKRLRFVVDHASIDIKDQLYYQALERLRSKYLRYPAVTEIIHAMANWHFEKGSRFVAGEDDTDRMSLSQAKTLCEEAISLFPKSYGAQHCKLLLASILSTGLDIQVESVNLPDQPALARIDFKNLTKAYIKIVKLDAKDKEELEQREYETMLSQLNKKRPFIKTTSIGLPNTKDYQKHTAEWAIPALPMGLYVVIVSDNEDFSIKKGRVGLVFTQHSYLAPMRRQNMYGETNFAIVHRKLGAPMAGVKATFYKPNYDSRRRKVEYVKTGESVSDKNGFVKTPVNSDQFRVEFSFGPDVLYPADNFYSYSSDYRRQGETYTHFFLDRAIYRPGQPLYFKALVINNDANGVPKVASNEKVTITLLDANYQEVVKMDLTTNAYGTVQGMFTTPTGGLLGAMSLRSSAGNSAHSFQVEEYKRPRFEVLLKPMEGTPRLGDKVSVRGEAQALAGSAVDGAQVQYRVVREVRYPWRPWAFAKMIYPPYGNQESMEIANGDLVTDAEGKFVVAFEALPDRSADRKMEPSFVFTVYVDVTDITGETRSTSNTYNLGYVGLEAQLNVDDQVEQNRSVAIGLQTNNLDGEAQSVKGRIEIYRLRAPKQAFLDRYWNKPSQWILSENDFKKQFPLLAYKNEDEKQSWARELQVYAQTFDTGQSDSVKIDMSAWPLGAYLIVLNTNDLSGAKVEAQKYFTLIGPRGSALPTHVDSRYALSKASYEPGEKAGLYLATAGERQVFYQLERNNDIIASGWLSVNSWAEWSQMITEEDRGNLQISLFSVKNNRADTWSDNIMVPWSNKDLKITYATFRDKLRPGQTEEWQIKLSGPAGERIAAEMVAAMYDASLDQFVTHNWSFSPFPYRYYSTQSWYPILFDAKSGIALERPRKGDIEVPYRAYPTLNWFGYYPGGMHYRGQFRKMMQATGAPARQAVEEEMLAAETLPPPPPAPGDVMDSVSTFDPEAQNEAAPPKSKGAAAPPAPVQIRKNLQETTFFFPQLNTDAQGNIVIKFNAGESLTRWKFLTFAHTTDLKYTLGQREVLTQKELMVLPNAPRFVREGDELWFTAKVSNLTAQALTGQIRLELYDAATMQPVSAAFGLQNPDLSFTAQAGQSAPASWRLQIPAGQAQGLTWRVIATAGSFSDGEENTMPVLTNRMLVTESLPLPVKGKSTETFRLEAMKRAGASPTLKHHRFTLEYTSNPAWYAVQALPYLMEYPYECTEQIFNRYYANALASSIANKYPKIKTVFDQWKNTPALESNLSKNQDLKSALLEETPWVMQAQDEAQQKKQIGLLFDLVKMSEERKSTLHKLAERQSASGGLPWFPGGQDNWYITQLVLEGLGHLSALGVDDYAKDPAVNALIAKGFIYVDEQLKKQYLELEKAVKQGHTKWDDDHLDHITAHYLYTASFFGKMDHEKSMRPIIDYYYGQAEKHWINKGNYEQGMLALALHRSGRKDAAQRIVRSLKERALHHAELGMYWKTDRGYFWYQLPIETQALMVELFAEVAKDDKSVEELKIWLLKNKQTNHWKTTKATASAVYALLANGENWLLEDQAAVITFPDLKKGAYEPQIKAAQQTAEAGTGYFSVSWEGNVVSDNFSEVKVKNPNKSIAWGALYWQYFEDLDKIKTFEETPLQLRKQLFKEVPSDRGPVLEAIDKSGLKPGDKLVVRLELRVDRDMEYVHLKDLRASGTEPVNVISQYKWQGGLGYYESTRDAATHFFMDYLPRGTYVFEYPLNVSHKGDFSNGITSIQCMYAPEFSSHSAGARITVK